MAESRYSRSASYLKAKAETKSNTAKKHRRRLPKWLLSLAAAAVLVLVCLVVTGRLPYKPDDSSVLNVEPAALNVWFFDVGQGDAALVMGPEGETILIDAGPGLSAARLRVSLHALGISEFDCAIFTHPHEDHIGGADDLLQAFGAKTVILSPGVFTPSASQVRMNVEIADCGAEVIEASPGRMLTLGSLKLILLAPCSVEYEDENDLSVVVRIEYGGISLLFTGDITEAAERDLLALYDPVILKCDLLKVGHHGSAGSSSEGFITAVSPEYAVISAGADNEYGHPAPSVLQRLKYSRIFRTDRDGTIHAVSDGTDFIFYTENGEKK